MVSKSKRIRGTILKYNFAPSFNVCDGNFLEITAANESFIPYFVHALWDIDGSQAGAAIESSFPYARHTLRDVDGC